MELETKTLIEPDLNVSFQELKFLLGSILDQHVNIRIKYRLKGGIWADHFLRVLLVASNEVILNDERNNKITVIKFLNDISEFELDKPYDDYQAGVYYRIDSESN